MVFYKITFCSFAFNKLIIMKIEITEMLSQIDSLPLDEKIEQINNLREAIHSISPFKSEPVDFVRWVKNDSVQANDYNPNKVAPPEMELLEVSIMNDGYTQPIVTWDNSEKGSIEVIDGFHRNRVGKESPVITKRVMGYLPIVNIRTEQSSKNDRIASTIRHNRARGKHQVDAMSEIVIELKNRNWTNQRISKQLGMDEEEVLRLCQISGLEHLFTDSDFSNAWESPDQIETYQAISDAVTEDELNMHKIPNEGDETRIFHTYDKWECHKAGFYASKKSGLTNEECEEQYQKVLGDPELFRSILEKLIIEWKYSCEHYLTNKSMNRIAWLGQAAVCYHSGVPSRYSPAWFKLTPEQQEVANQIAHEMLNKWLSNNRFEEIGLSEALIIGRQVELY
jgi:ParB-like chromosome segregation protein Spo0J